MSNIGQDGLRLEVSVDLPDGVLPNIIANPDGDLGSWGWVTPVANTVMTATTVTAGNALQFKTTAAQACYTLSEMMTATAGLYYAARVDIAALTASHTVQASLVFYDATRAQLSQTAVVGISAAGTLFTAAFQAPTNTAYVALRLDWKSGSGNPATNSTFTFRHAMVTYTTTGSPSIIRTNLITNPSFETNVSGWSIGSGSDTSTPLRLRTDVPAKVGSHSIDVSMWANTDHVVAGAVYQGYINGPLISSGITAGLPYAVQVAEQYINDGATATAGGVLCRWYNSAGTQIGGDLLLTEKAITATGWTVISGVLTAPAGATKFRIFPYAKYKQTDAGGGIDLLLDAVMVEQATTVGAYFDGATADTSTWLYDWTGTPNGSTSTAQTVPGAFQYTYVDPYNYANVLADTHSIDIDRDELNVGTLTATVINSALDPASSSIIAPGRRCRLTAKTGPDDTDASWSPIFTGKLIQGEVSYDLLQAQESRRARITLTATDNLTKLAQVAAPVGVGTIAEVPYLLEGAGVPWNVNGSGNQVASAVAAAYNDSSTVVDQVALARDSALGYAWVDRFNVLNVFDAAQMSPTVKAVLDETSYNTDISIDFDTARVINAVQVALLTYDAGHGVAGSTNYPSDDGAYVLPGTDGDHMQTFTVTGIAPANIPAFANSIMAANGTPQRRVNSLVLPITVENVSDFAALDLYDLVEVINERANLDENHRIIGITHSITAQASGTGGPGAKWLMTLTFAADGTVAMPQLLPAPQVGSTVAGPLVPYLAGAVSTTCDASGYVTLTHGGTTTPRSVQLSGRNSGWEVYLTAVSATSFTVRMLGRSTGTPPTAATAVAFDWACFF